MKLHELVPNPGSKKNRKRVGRGISAGQGKTAGRGTKGQGSRSGEGGRIYRQGGNLPVLSPPAVHARRRLHAAEPRRVQRGQPGSAGRRLQGRCRGHAGDPGRCHLLRDAANPVKVLGRGELKVALKVRVHRVSAAAKAKIEAAGGSVETIRVGRDARRSFMKTAFTGWRYLWKSEDIRRKLLITLGHPGAVPLGRQCARSGRGF